VCLMQVEDDGLVFEPATVTAEKITEDDDYQGIRVRFIGHLENARIPIQIDLGFGDVITPAPVEAELPTLLELPPPKLLTYPKESVIAEKLEALVSLGMVNSRMKDLHDIRSLAREFSFDGAVLSEAVASTFKRRGTKLPDDIPLVFTSEFSGNAEKKKQWAAFCHKNKSYVEELPLQSVCEEIETFLMPVIRSLRTDSKFARNWMSKNRWT